MDGTDLVRVDIEGQVAKVVLNRPEKLNALNKQMWSMVGDAFNELNKWIASGVLSFAVRETEP